MVEGLVPTAELFALHTRLFINTIADLDDRDALVRPNDRTNSIAFIGGHLVETRAWMGRLVGLETPAPFGGQLEHQTGIDEISLLPTVAALREHWNSLSRALEARLDAVTAADLSAPSGQRFPVVSGTVLGALTFLMHHEAYHIGQLAYLRKFIGLPPMSYR
ncbi:MAG: DinB family protein [Gemmatimonadales bacterium]